MELTTKKGQKVSIVSGIFNDEAEDYCYYAGLVYVYGISGVLYHKHANQRLELALLLGGCHRYGHWPFFFKSPEEVLAFIDLCDELEIVG